MNTSTITVRSTTALAYARKVRTEMRALLSRVDTEAYWVREYVSDVLWYLDGMIADLQAERSKTKVKVCFSQDPAADLREFVSNTTYWEFSVPEYVSTLLMQRADDIQEGLGAEVQPL